MIHLKLIIFIIQPGCQRLDTVIPTGNYTHCLQLLTEKSVVIIIINLGIFQLRFGHFDLKLSAYQLIFGHFLSVILPEFQSKMPEFYTKIAQIRGADAP